MTCGIYAIVCDETWRSYVGQAVDIHRRVKDHFQSLRRGDHTKELQADFNKYGQEAFHFEILEIVNDTNLLIEKEKYWYDFGCNLYNKMSGYHEIESLTQKQKDYFWSKVDIKEDINLCWEYLGYVAPNGYGRTKFNQKQCVAHRMAYFLANEDSNHNVVICHKCNNRKCCNPNHLYGGTIQDNNLDIFKSEAKGKITWEQVNKVREKFKENPNITGRELHDWFFKNVAEIEFSREYLIDVAMNIKWVDKEYLPPTRLMRKLDFQKAEEIRQLSKDGLSYGKIIKLFIFKYDTKINPATISHIINNKLYRREQYGDVDLLNQCT